MFFRNKSRELDASFFDPDHDLDLVAMFNNARTESELEAAAGLSRSRMRARRNSIGPEPRRNRRAIRSADPR
jgi:hypothetical protein